MALEILMKGSDYPKYDTWRIVKFGDNAVAGISAGRSKNAKEKFSKDIPNEDSLGIVSLQDNWQLYMVADSNTGHNASEIAVSEFAKIISVNLKNADPIKALYVSVFELDDRIRNSKTLVPQRGDENELVKDISTTTFIAALKKEDDIYYVSVGDSFAYRIESSQITLLNQMQHKYHPVKGWLGCPDIPLITRIHCYFENDDTYKTLSENMWNYIYGESTEPKPVDEVSKLSKDFLFKKQFDEISNVLTYDSVRHIVDVGRLTLTLGSTLVLVTDGIVPYSSGISIENFGKILSNVDLETGVNDYFQTQLKAKAEGMSDNTSIVAVRL